MRKNFAVSTLMMTASVLAAGCGTGKITSDGTSEDVSFDRCAGI